MPSPDIQVREQAIINYLKENYEGASVKDIYTKIKEQLNDTVSQQAYWKIVYRMENDGKIEAVEIPGEGRRYKIAQKMMADNPISLDDLYEMLPWAKNTQAIAAYIDSQNYYEENRKTVIRKAAELLLNEDPRELFFTMIKEKIELLECDISIIREIYKGGKITDDKLHKRAMLSYEDLDRLIYRYLSIPKEAIDLPSLQDLEAEKKDIFVDEDRLKETLKQRIFGEKFINIADVSDSRNSLERSQLMVSGSDGSMHAGVLALQTAPVFYEDYSQIITFNNSVAYAPPTAFEKKTEANPKPYIHSIPLTREILDDPQYKGMVIAPFMHPNLTEAEYEHMARCATDVVQFRVDAAIITGNAQNIHAGGKQWKKPGIHLRDGTITPQEREFGHYNRVDSYGDMVREGIRLNRQILSYIMSSRKPPVFAGAVKSTQLKIFSDLINWYIIKGSKARLGKPIEPNWNIASTKVAGDNIAMTSLLSCLPQMDNKSGRYYTSCIIVREFHSLTEFYRTRITNGWTNFFNEKKSESILDFNKYSGLLPYIAGIDVEDDDFVFLCENANYGMFYIGHTGAEPPPILPRYEFLISRRSITEDKDNVTQLLNGNLRKVVEAIDETSLQFDRDHNFLSKKTLVRIIPRVIYQAHEYVKHLGKKLESELKSSVIKNLIKMQRIRIQNKNDITINPVPTKIYIEKFAKSMQDKKGMDSLNEDANR